MSDPLQDLALQLDKYKGHDAAEDVESSVTKHVTPHVAQNASDRKSAVPDETAWAVCDATSRRKCKLNVQGCGWAKTVGSTRQVMVRGLERVDQKFVLIMAGYNLVRMRSVGEVRARSI